MYKILSILLILSYTLLLATSDFDMDGVEDSIDNCPNTPITDLVDIKGCTIKSLASLHHFDIIMGVSYSQTSYTGVGNSDTISESLQVDYYYKDFSVQVSTSYYDSSSSSYSDNGMGDSFIGAYYKLYPLSNLNLRFGLGAILPTYDSTLNNNNTDYVASLNLSYMLEKINIFGGYNYTMINDDESPTVFIGKQFGVNDINFSGGCSSVHHIAFDHYGRPYSGVNKAKNLFAKYMDLDCLITMSFVDEDIEPLQITIYRESGFVSAN